MKTLVLAAMPLPMMATTASLPNIDLWINAEPMLRSALECSSELDITDERLKRFPQYAEGSWEITPARDFSIMGLPISTITLFIDTAGKLGSSYTAVIEKRSLGQVEQAISLLQQKGPRAGRMSAIELGLRGPVVLNCTVSTE